MSKRNFGDIKCLMHFDFPYLNEPNEGLEEEVGIETVSNHGAYFNEGPKFGYRCLATSTDSYISISNNHHTFTLNPHGYYEAEAFLYIENAPDDFVVSTFNGHSFVCFENSVTWNEAKLFCEALGGHLATSTSQDKNEFLIELLSEHDGYAWIGFYSNNGGNSFSWVNNEELSFSSWGEQHTEGDNRCVELNPSGKWDIYDPDNDTSYFICEWDYDSLPSGNQIMRFGNLTLFFDHDLRLSVHAPTWGILATSEADALTLDTWNHILLRISNTCVCVFVNAKKVISAPIYGQNIIIPKNAVLGCFDGWLDEFVFRHNIGSDIPVIPEQPYSGSLDVSTVGGFGNGSDGSVSIDEDCVLNSSALIQEISDARSFSVSDWDEGLFAPHVGSEVMILVHSPLTTTVDEYPDVGLYDFARIISIDENNIVLDRDINSDFTLNNDLLETYNVYVFTVPNFINLTINSTVNPPNGGVVAFRCKGNCDINGSIITMGYGPTRYDLHQMMNSKLVDRFLIAGGGGIFIACKGTLSASEEARLGASWSGLGDDEGNGAAGYGGKGGDIVVNKKVQASGGSSGVGGGGGAAGGGSGQVSQYARPGGNAPGGEGEAYSAYCAGGGAGCGGNGGSGKFTYAGGAAGGGQAGSQGQPGTGKYKNGNTANINGGDFVRVLESNIYGGGGAGGGAPGGHGGIASDGSVAKFNAALPGACIIIFCKILNILNENLSTGGQAGINIGSYLGHGSGGGGGGTGFCYIACERQVILNN